MHVNRNNYRLFYRVLREVSLFFELSWSTSLRVCFIKTHGLSFLIKSLAIRVPELQEEASIIFWNFHRLECC